MPWVRFVGRAQPVRVLLRGPAGAVTRADRQRPELVERETPIRKPIGDLLDPVQLRFEVRVAGFLPGPGPLKRDGPSVQDLPQPFPPDAHHPDRRPSRVGAAVTASEIAGQLADTPVRERQPILARASGGRLDDDREVSVADPAGTAARPARVQAGQPHVVERVDHIPHGVLVRGYQAGDRRHRRAGGRGHDDQRPTDPACASRRNAGFAAPTTPSGSTRTTPDGQCS